jgi:hypothetical protein
LYEVCLSFFALIGHAGLKRAEMVSPTSIFEQQPPGESPSGADSAKSSSMDRADIAQAELALKLATIDSIRADIENKKAETERTKGELERKRVNWVVVGPVLTTLVVAIIGLFSNAYVTYLNGKNQLELETIRATNTLIVEAVKTGSADQTVANRNLQFFLDAGLLKDPDKKIANLVKQGKTPVIAVQSSPSFGKGTQIPSATPKPIHVEVGDNRTLRLESSVPPIGLHRVTLQTFGTGVTVDCGFSKYKFKCIRLNRSVGANEDGAANFVFDQPLPMVAFLLSEPVFEQVPTGATIAARPIFKWESFDGSAQSRLLQQAQVAIGHWTALEPVETVKDGAKALEWMTSMVGQKSANECLGDRLCGEFLFFKLEDNRGDGIAYCGLARALEVRSLPAYCDIYGYREGGKWYIRALLSPQSVEGGFGSGPEGLTCVGDSKISLDRAASALKESVRALFGDIDLREKRAGKKFVFAGKYSGKPLYFTNKPGDLIQTETTTIHGAVEVDGKQFSLSGALIVAKGDGKGPFHELSDQEQEEYERAFASNFSAKLGTALGAKLQCDNVPYFH